MIAIILVEPENPDNIGAVARAMKNMGLSDLRLVKPPRAWKSKGKKMAVSAADVLKTAKTFKSVPEAIADSSWTIATTRRLGAMRGHLLAYEEAIEKIWIKSQKSQVSLLFGKESKGLDNAALELCDAVVTIPSHDVYPSLNLSQAVMVIAFSLFLKSAQPSPKKEDLLFCEKEEVLETLLHFKKALQVLGYEKQGNNLQARIVATFHRILKRGGMLEAEGRMIRGLSGRILKRIKKD